jgi:hypothetical protein
MDANTAQTTTNGRLDQETCLYCGFMHNGYCPRLAAIEYFPNGTVKRVEFHNQPSQRVAWNKPTEAPMMDIATARALVGM